MKVAVVGSGIVGLSTAYALVRRGVEVSVVSDRPPGAGASSNNAGWVIPAEAGPVPAPGVVLQTIRWMARQDSPVYIRPSLSPSFATFMLRMLRACTRAAYDRSFDATARLAAGTLEELDAWAADGLRFETHEEGELRLYVDERELAAGVADLERFRRHGSEVAHLTGDEARTMEPAISDEVVGAIHFPGQRHVRPASVVEALVTRLRTGGVTFIDGAVTGAWALPAGGVELRGPAFEPIRADALVIAAGAWSPRIARLLGSRLPIRPGKGYSVDYAPPAVALRSMVYLTEAHCVVTPLDGATRVAGTMEFGGLDERMAPARVRAIREAPGRYLRGWDPDAPAHPPSAGLRPMTPDGIALIGRLRPYDQVYVASGHAMLGLTLGPRTGTELAALIVDGGTRPLLEPFSPARFGA